MPLSKLLVLSASYGAGHQQAAFAVRDALARISPHTEVRIMDYLHSVHPTLDSIVKYCYLTSVRYAPALYGLFYKGTSQIPPDSLIQRQLNSLGIAELEATLDEFQPDAVFSTFPTPAGVMSYLREQGRTSVPAATVITDHAIHSQWIHPHTEMYFVGSHHVRRGLIARGIASDSVHVTGIPIRPTFLDPLDKHTLLRKYGLRADVPTVLVMGGAYGVMGDIHTICEELFHYPHPVQTLVVAGRNEKMKAQLEAMLRGGADRGAPLREAGRQGAMLRGASRQKVAQPGAARAAAELKRAMQLGATKQGSTSQTATQPARVFGYVSEIHELMGVADLILTKAGGLTVSEALSLRLPMILYRPIPGQEVQNAEFLVKNKVAVLAGNRREVSEQLRSLLVEHPDRLLKMRRRAERMAQGNAADSIAERLVELASIRDSSAHYSHL